MSDGWMNPLVGRIVFGKETSLQNVYALPNSGRRGNQVILDGVTYSSWRQAVRETGLTKSALRWRVQHR